MTFDDFYKAYRSHDGEFPPKVPLDWDGYEMRYKNGDVYRYEMKLKRRKEIPSIGFQYGLDDFFHHAFWNGEEIENP